MGDYTGRFAVVSSAEKTPKRDKKVKKQVSKELKIEENLLDQVVSSLPEDSCERLLAEALETTVVSETCKKEDIWITSPPDVHVLENNFKTGNGNRPTSGEFLALPVNNENIDDDDDDKFEEMSKQKDQPKETIDIEEDCNEEFEEMTKTNREEIDIDNEDEIHFKIKEEDIDEDDEDLDENDQVVGGQIKLENLIDVETTATSAANLATSDVDLLGNDIVKSIEKANLLYDGGNQQGLGQLFKPSIDGNGTGAADNLVAGCSSEDDLGFKPVTSGRKNKKQKQKNDNNNKNKNGTGGAAAATDSSCSVDLGSSFEADDLDVNKLLSEVIPVAVQADSEAPAVIAEVQLVEEKAALEDVFKFDSELGSNTNKESKAVVLPPTELNMSTSLNYDDSNNSDEKSNSLSQSMTYGGCSTGTTSNSESNMSESSVGNSPNPRAASKKKGKSKKKKR